MTKYSLEEQLPSQGREIGICRGNHLTNYDQIVKQTLITWEGWSNEPRKAYSNTTANSVKFSLDVKAYEKRLAWKANAEAICP